MPKKKVVYGIVVLLIIAAAGAYFLFFSQPVSQLPRTEHFLGSAGAKVVMVEYSDFQCPACGAAEPAVEQVIQSYGNRIKFVYKHFPLTNIHQYSQKAAESSECAGAQGKFWEMHDKLFANQNALRITDLKIYAQQIGLNTTEFNSCLDGGAAAANVKADFSEGLAEKVRATPTFFINGRKIEGGVPFEEFKAVIDQELAAAG
ncbi:MAG: thioredoxin domain-containing protein [Candidatus Aenigmatarchaeota archaeon]